MTTPIPSASELHAYCFQLVEKAHADQRTPWRCWTVDEGAELLQLLAMRNLYGERWPRLLQSGAKVARQGWQSYVAVMADMVEAHHDQVCALVDNNPETWHALCREVHTLTLRYLTRYRMSRQRARLDSEDITQTMCLKLLLILPRYPWDVNFVAWLTNVTQHLTIDVMRQHAALDTAVSYDLDMLQESYDETSHEIRARDRLRAASHDHSSLLFDEALSEALTCITSAWQRNAFVHCRLLDESLSDVASSYDATYRAISSALLRAEQHLRAFLAEHPDHFNP